MEKDKYIAISKPALGEEEWLAIREPILSGWLTQGPKVAAFEKRFAELHGVKHAIASTSCTTALHLMLVAEGIGAGDEVIVPSFTWVATANVVEMCGARPVFADIDLQTFNIDPRSVAEKKTSRTKAVLAVHLFGRSADMDAIQESAPGVPIFEDAACATGASYKARMAGSLGKAAAFSFHPRKSITTGEGGMVTTNDSKFARRVNELRNHGASISEEKRHVAPKPYLLPEFDVMGFNYRMTDLQAAVGLVQIEKMKTLIEERARGAKFYSENLAKLSWLKTPEPAADYGHGWQAYVCYVDPKTAPIKRDALMDELHLKGIATRPGTHAIHTLGYYRKKYNLSPQDFPASLAAHDNAMALPLHNQMTQEDYERVVAALLSF